MSEPVEWFLKPLEVPIEGGGLSPTEFPDQGGMKEGSEMAAKGSFFLCAEVKLSCHALF